MTRLPDGPHIIEGRQRFVIGGKVYSITKCKRCGRNIAFVPHRTTGRPQPRDADGRLHFITCPAKGGRKRKPPTLPFIN